MKKALIPSLILILALLTLAGCGQTGTNINNGENTNDNAPKRGDLFEYSTYLQSKSYTTDSNKTGSKEAQSFKTNTNTKWVVLSNVNGVITITSDENTLSTVGKGLGLNNQAGYINGVDVLNELCNNLYTTEYGTARSFKTEDLLKLAKDEKDRKNHANNKLEITFNTGTLYDGGAFKKITSPITIKDNSLYYTFDKGLELNEVLFNGIREYKGKSIYENEKYFWLGDKGVRLYQDKTYGLDTATYGINYFSGYLVGINECFVGDKYEGHIDQTHFYGIRPVVELKEGLNFKKITENGVTTWSIAK